MRLIDDILLFRGDVSPFLVHLTKRTDTKSPAEVLEKILTTKRLRAGAKPISDARWGIDTRTLTSQELKDLFGAICFTETPLSEVHCLLDIEYRSVNLAPYGLVFLKKPLRERGVAPVLYLNNDLNDQQEVVEALCSLARTAHYRDAAERLLPLLAFFGERLGPNPPAGKVDFSWEREWRYPAARGALAFDTEDVFVGLCPHDKIDQMEELLPDVGFVDPRRPMKWYATKLIAARQRLDIKHSVV